MPISTIPGAGITSSTTLTTPIVSTTLGVGGATPAASGAGITFPATQSASSDANTLDDYEEGTWTPNVGGNATYVTNYGHYTKIGRLVTVQFEVQINVLGTGQNLAINNLPFASGSTGNGQGGSVGYFSNAANNVVFVTLRLDQGSTQIALATLSSAGATLSTGTAFFANNTRILGSMTYMSA